MKIFSEITGIKEEKKERLSERAESERKKNVKSVKTDDEKE